MEGGRGWGKGSRETNEEALDNRRWRPELGGGVEMERREQMSGGGMKPEALGIGGMRRCEEWR